MKTKRYKKVSLLCPSCGSNNIHTEIVERSESTSSGQVTKKVTVHYCAQENCGHTWE